MPFYIISGLIGFAVIAVSCELFANSIAWIKIRFKISGIYEKTLSAAGLAFISLIIPFTSVITIPGERGQEISTGALTGTLLMISAVVPAIIAFVAAGSYDKKIYDKKPDEKFFRQSLEFFGAAVVCALIFSMFPMPVKKSLAFLFLAAFIFYVFKTAKKRQDEPGEIRSLYFSRKKIPEGRLVLLQGSVSVLGMACGAVFYIAGVSHAAPAAGVSGFLISLLISPLIIAVPAVLNGLNSLKRMNEIQALASLSMVMVFQATVVIFAGIAATDWILGPRSALAAAVAAVSAAVPAFLIRTQKKAAVYMFIPGAALFIIYILAVFVWVK